MSYHMCHDRLATPQFLWWSVQPAAGEKIGISQSSFHNFYTNFKQTRGTPSPPEAPKPSENPSENVPKASPNMSQHVPKMSKNDHDMTKK